MSRAHGVTFVACALLAASGLASAASPLSYTTAQADAGRLAYYENCAECHGGELNGQYGPALAGPGSRDQFESPAFVWSYMTLDMPHGHPGELTQTQYVDIMAFLLQQHHHAPGSRPLRAAAIAVDQTPLGE